MMSSQHLFQFTPLREGRPGHQPEAGLAGAYFNSRPCGRGDGCGNVGKGRDHEFQFTPLREGRPAAHISRAICEYQISIHAPAGGATVPAPVWITIRKLFQFTPLREGRRVAYHLSAASGYFNSRPCGRGDRIKFIAAYGRARFQFTPLREGRPPTHHTSVRPTPYFNSRPCGRGDSKRVQKKKMTIVPFAEKRGKFILL